MRLLFIAFQYCIPQHLLSRIAGKLAASTQPSIKRTFINLFMRKFNISLDEAITTTREDFASFNDFFCRALKEGARPIAEGNTIVSPADGSFSQLGTIKSGKIFQAKGHEFSAEELLANAEMASLFEDGEFATIYLSPSDYHRVHMPIKGTLTSMSYVPGDLFSVNTTTTESVPRLFARNERAVCMFETEIGPVAVVLVGALIVAAIETVWAGDIAPAATRHIEHWHYDHEHTLEKGEEMGRFKLGSTAVILFPRGSINWSENAAANGKVKMGEKIADILPS